MTINGKLYDANTGKPLDVVSRQPLAKTRTYGSFDVKPSSGVHSGPARSQTLRRSGLSKPAVSRPITVRHVRTVSPVTTHPAVSRFGRPADASINEAHTVKPSDILSSINAADAADRPTGFATQVQNYTPAAQVATPRKKARQTASRSLTDHAIAQAPTHAAKAAHRKRVSKTNQTESNWRRFQKRIRLSPPLVITGIILAVLIASVICYLTIPALSLFVAAKSANVEAAYPNYVPAGYHFKGPVTYREGTVTMNFASGGSDKAFTIEQNNTGWDSGAVLDNYVLARSQNYLTYSQGGITVYTFGSEAAWVNAGVLHTIDGSAGLTSEQILRIAGSM